MSNRIFCYRQTSRWRRRLLNFNYLVYGARAILHGLGILRDYGQLKPELEKHKLHYQTIRFRAEAHRSQFLHSTQGLD
jgi:hypothetical protein